MVALLRAPLSIIFYVKGKSQMEGMDESFVTEPVGNKCSRCGCVYSFITDSCPECRDLTDKEAEIKKNRLYDSRIKQNKSLAYSFFIAAVILLIIIVLSW